MRERLLAMLSTPTFWVGVVIGAVDASFIWLSVLLLKGVL